MVQLRGRANTKPSNNLHPYIVAFLLDKNIGITKMNPSTYKPEQNFMLADLNKEEVEKIYTLKPNLFQEFDISQILIKNPTLVTLFDNLKEILSDSRKRNLIEVHPELAAFLE